MPKPSMGARFSSYPAHHDNSQLQFPNLTPIIQRDRSGMGLEKGYDNYVGAIIARIQERDGKYVIINHRTTEWVAIEVLKSILTRRGGGLVKYKLWMSHINDDIQKHTDMIIEAKTGVGTYYFSVDLTYGINGVDVKIAEYAQWKYSQAVHIGKGNIEIPHMILGIEGAVIYKITKTLDYSLSNRDQKVSIEGIREGVSNIVRELLPIQIIIATPESRNNLLTAHHKEVAEDFRVAVGGIRIGENY